MICIDEDLLFQNLWYALLQEFSGCCASQIWLNTQLSPVQSKVSGTKLNDTVQKRSQMYQQHCAHDSIVCFSEQISEKSGEGWAEQKFVGKWGLHLEFELRGFKATRGRCWGPKLRHAVVCWKLWGSCNWWMWSMQSGRGQEAGDKDRGLDRNQQLKSNLLWWAVVLTWFCKKLWRDLNKYVTDRYFFLCHSVALRGHMHSGWSWKGRLLP